MHVLVTGGAGYIGRHVVCQLFQAGHTVEILDNFHNASMSDVHELEELLQTALRVHAVDIVYDIHTLRRVLRNGDFDAVVHLAALKSVPASFQDPLAYHQVNVAGTLNLTDAMDRAGCCRIVFSSSACVYGTQEADPDNRQQPLEEALWPRKCTPLSPYSLSKDLAERLLRGLPQHWTVCALRYFNPLGAHPSGRLGDRGKDNVMGKILECVETHTPFVVHGDDYNTEDGTCVRDYIHVQDVARAHVEALEKTPLSWKGAVNVGLGRGCSVLRLIQTMQEAAGRSLPVSIGPRRHGDAPVSIAATDYICRMYPGWSPVYGLRDMCRHAWAAHLRRTSNSSGAAPDDAVHDVRRGDAPRVREVVHDAHLQGDSKKVAL